MSMYEDARAALECLTSEEIRRLLGELERQHGVMLTPDRNGEESFRCAVAYGVPPHPLGKKDDDLRGYVVRLVKVGPNKIPVIKTIREVCGYGFVETMQIVNTAPSDVRVFGCDGKDGVDLLVEELQSVGATMEITRTAG